MRKVGYVLGTLFLPSLIAGTILMFFGYTQFIVGCSFLALALFIFLYAVFVKVKMFMVENEASNIGMKYLGMIMTKDELKIARKFLNDARLTYLSDLLRLMFGFSGTFKRKNMFN